MAPGPAVRPAARGALHGPVGEHWDWWRVVEAIASIALGVALLAWGVPLVAGEDWSGIGAVFSELSPWQVVVLGLVWQFGLWIHTIALCAALPGLSSPRAWFLNQSGSAVSNILPFGGAAGTVLNYSTARVWGFSTSAFLRWAVATNIWDTLGKLVVPALAVLWLVAAGATSPEALVSAAVAGAVTLGLLVALTWFMLHRDLGMKVIGRLLDTLVRSLHLRRLREEHFADDAVQFRRDLADLVAHAWGRLTVGKAAYALSQAFLLWLCVTWLGGEASPAVVFAAFAAERVLSMAVVTPGATGVVQSALGNLPELFISIFALRAGLVVVVQTALIGSILANSLLVLGLAFTVGGLRHGSQKCGTGTTRLTAMLLAEGDHLEVKDFGALKTRLSVGDDPFELPAAGVHLDDLERSLVVQALRRAGGNQTKAAALLGLNRDQIRYRIEKFGLTATP